MNKPEPRNQRLPREDRVRDIMKAAREVFCERGFANSSISEIAQRAGIAQGTIYKFFGSKRDVVVAVLEEWYGSMQAELLEELPGIQGARDRLRYFVWRHLTFIKQSPEMCRLCSNEFSNDGDSYQAQILTLNKQHTGPLTTILKDGIASGDFSPDIPIALVRDLILGGTDNAVAGFLYRDHTLDPAQLADDVTTLILRGIVAKDTAPAVVVAPDQLAALTRRLEAATDRLEALDKPT